MHFYIYQLENYLEHLDLNSFNEFNEFEDLKFKFINLELTELESKINNYQFEGEYDLKGSILIDKELKLNKQSVKYSRNIPFNLRIGSGFVFIKTDREREKIDAVNCLDKWLQTKNNKLIEFIPLRNKTANLIKNFGGLKSAKFFTEDGIKNIESIFENIVYSNVECKKILNNQKNIPLDYQKSSENSIDIISDFDINKKIKIKLLSSILMKYPLYEADFKVELNNNAVSVSYYGDALKLSPSINPTNLETIIQIFENAMYEQDFYNLADQNRKKISEKC